MSYMLTDVDECVLQTDVCNEYASCQNIDGTFNCTCDEGYEGNGRTRCDGTLCFPFGLSMIPPNSNKLYVSIIVLIISRE